MCEHHVDNSIEQIIANVFRRLLHKEGGMTENGKTKGPSGWGMNTKIESLPTGNSV